MPIIKQVTVMDQTMGPSAKESCGYHAFKNALLSLLLLQKKITEATFNDLIGRADVFDAIFKSTKQFANAAGDIDLTLPRFVQLLRRVKSGAFDFLAPFGVTKADLISLPLHENNTGNISVVNFYPTPNALNFGLMGMEDDLFAAAAVVKFARTRGEANQVFALGLNDQHWITAYIEQNASGERTWRFMDSWRNQSKYMQSVVQNIESILNKNEADLSVYSIQAYESSSALFSKRYRLFFDENTGLPNPGRADGFGPRENETRNAKEFFIDDHDNLEQFTSWIESRYIFMQTAGWLSSDAEIIRNHIKQLFHLTDYIVKNTHANDLVTKQKLGPILTIVQKYIAGPIKAKDDKTIPIDNATITQQTIVALNATNKDPKPTEGFLGSIVNAIIYLLTGLKNAIEYLGRSIGLVS